MKKEKTKKMKINLHKFQFGSALTTVEPGSSHAKFQYKPLGFEKFAAPLQKMQGYYDQAQAQIEDLDFQIKHLPYGTDPAKAKELADQMTVKRDQIVNDLTKSKDYRNASRSIKKMQNNWAKNKHRQALESQYTNWMALDKEQKERFTKSGKLDRDAYAQWKARSVQEFEAKDSEGNLGGTNFKDDGLDGTWNTLGRQVRLDDMTKEIRDQSLKVAGLIKAEKWDELSRYQIDEDFIKNYKVSHDKLTKEDIASKVEGYLRNQPDYVKFFEEKADYSFWQLQQDPKAYKKKSDELIRNTLGHLNSEKDRLSKLEKKDKSLLKDEKHLKRKDLIDSNIKSLQTEDPDKRLKYTKKLFEEQELGKDFNADHLGRLLEHDYTKQFATYNAIPGAAAARAAREAAANASTTPVNYDNIDLAGMSETASVERKSLLNRSQGINNYGNGIFRTVTMGAKSSATGGDGDYTLNGQDYRKKGATWTKKVGNTYVPLTEGNLPQRINTLNNQAKSKRTELSKNPKELAAKQLKLFQLHAQYGEDPNVLREELNKNGFNVSSNDVSELNKVFNTQKDFLMDERAALENQYYATTEAENRYEMLQESAVNTPEFSNAANWKGTINLTDEELTKANNAGINVQNITSQGPDGLIEINSVSVNDYARIKGKSAKDMYLSGDRRVKDALGSRVYEIGADETINKKIMSHRVIGSKSTNTALKNEFNGIEDLLDYVPAFGSDWRGAPGFDDEGNLKTDTKFDFSDGQGFRLIKHGKNMVIEANIKTDEGTKQIYIRPKKGYSSGLDNMLDNIKNGLGDSPADEETKSFINGWMFDNRIPNNVDEISFNAVGFPEYQGGKNKEFDKLTKVYGPNGHVANAMSIGSFVALPELYPAARTEFMKVKLKGKDKYFVMLRNSDGNFEGGDKNAGIRFNTINDAKSYVGSQLYK